MPSHHPVHPTRTGPSSVINDPETFQQFLTILTPGTNDGEILAAAQHYLERYANTNESCLENSLSSLLAETFRYEWDRANDNRDILNFYGPHPLKYIRVVGSPAFFGDGHRQAAYRKWAKDWSKFPSDPVWKIYSRSGFYPSESLRAVTEVKGKRRQNALLVIQVRAFPEDQMEGAMAIGRGHHAFIDDIRDVRMLVRNGVSR